MNFDFSRDRRSTSRLAGAVLAAALLAACTRGSAAPAPPPAAPPPDGGDAQRLVALVDYVAGDYGLAVRQGTVVSPAEYEEQLRFLADARGMAASLLGPAAEADPLWRLLAEAEEQVRQRAPEPAVSSACRAARDAAIARFGLRIRPGERPSLPRARELYARNCVACHGARGDAATERARQLDPPPASFREPARLRELSPYRVYNALTFGVPGTAMASFAEALTPAERWDLAFYVFHLGHADRPAQGPVAVTLGETASLSDRELLAQLAADGRADAEAALSFVRREAAFAEPPASAGLARTRRQLREAQAAALAGRAAAAERAVLDTYLESFEALEPRLAARDPRTTAEAEAAFHVLRAAVRQGDADGVRSAHAHLDALLARLSGEQRALLPFGAAFLIYAREGIEAALLVAALLAGVRRLGRPEAARAIHLGWLAAVPAGLATFFVLDRLLRLGADQRELIEALVALAAAAVLFSVSFWMISRVESRRWMAFLRQRVEASLSRRNLALLAGLAFLAVYREAAETILFTQALLLDAEGAALQVWAGAATGLALVVVAAVALDRAALRLPLAPFFAVSGVLLCVLAVSFAGAGIHELVAAGYLSPRPVRAASLARVGLHPDLTALAVQLTIVLVIAGAGLSHLARPALARARRRG